MKRLLAGVALLLCASAAVAQVDPAPPDYSKPTLIRLLADMPEQKDRSVQFHVGSVEFRALGTRWRIAYLPVMMPLSGSYNTGRGIGGSIPNPFVLTGTVIPYTARNWRRDRAVNSELKRIEKMERAKIRVNVTAQ